MGEKTEAECLLDHGAAFPRRAGIGLDGGGMALVGVKPGAFAIYLDDEPYYHLDLEGRWQRAVVDGVHYLKGLDGSTEALDRVREDGSLVLRRRVLSLADAMDLDQKVRGTGLELLEVLARGDRVIAPREGAVGLDQGALADLLERVAGWDATAWFRQREAFRRTYGPAERVFLPPSCARPIVVKATQNEAATWPFGSGREMSEIARRSRDELSAHAGEVAGLWGRRAAQARGVVLASDDALRFPTDEVVEWLEAIEGVFPMEHARGRARPRISDRPVDVPTLDGVFTYLGTPEGALRPSDDWKRLAAANLRWVDVGVFSGSSEVCATQGILCSEEAVGLVVNGLKEAAIGIGIVVPVGVGGRELGTLHVAASVALLQRLGLRRGDIIYLVNARELLEPANAVPWAKCGLTAADDAVIARELDEFKQGLDGLRRDGGVKVVPYSLAKAGAGAT